MKHSTIKNACPVCRSDLVNASCANCGLMGKRLSVSTGLDGEGPMTIDLEADVPAFFYVVRGSNVERSVIQYDGLPNVICKSIWSGYVERVWKDFVVISPSVPLELTVQRFGVWNGPKVRKSVKELKERGSVTKEEWDSMYLNSYERIELLPALTNDALTDWVDRVILPNCQQCSEATYDGLMIAHIVPLLLKKLKGKK